MDDRQVLIEAWKQTVAVQMHFNDIAMKIRAFALTLIAAILTAQSFTTIRIVWLPIVAALGCWMAFYLMDRWWYHYLLLGAVLHGAALERYAADQGLEIVTVAKRLVRRPMLGITNRISELNREGFPFAAKYKMDLYYLLVGAGIFLILPARIEFTPFWWIVSVAVIAGLFTAWLIFAIVGTRRTVVTPGFSNESGKYQTPDIVVSGGKVVKGKVPLELECGKAVYIYSSDIQLVNNCQDLGGPNDSANATCLDADKAARLNAAQVTCPAECPKTVTEVYRGWDCGLDQPSNKNYSVCAVELKVKCPFTN